VRQRVVFQSRPVSRLRYTQLGVWARPPAQSAPQGVAVAFPLLLPKPRDFLCIIAVYLEHGERVCEGGAHQVRAGRESLAELDERGA
jgi:hypothetical protein